MATIIMDFDGTIADSFAVVVDIFQQLTRRSQTLPVGEIERLRDLSPLQVARQLGVKLWRVPFLIARGRSRMRRHMDQVKAIRGMPEAIKQLATDGHKLYIMSSNSTQNINSFVKRHNLDEAFIRIYGGVGLFGKARMLRRVVRQDNLNKSDTYYVGDEVRDIEAARAAGVQSISVMWGFNNTKALGARNPDFLVRKPAELADILKVHGK